MTPAPPDDPGFGADAELVRAKSRIYARLLVELGYARKGAVREALERQEADLATGRVRFLALYLVDAGVLDRAKAEEASERLEREVAACSFCHRLFRVGRLDPGRALACRCGNVLVVPGRDRTPAPGGGQADVLSTPDDAGRGTEAFATLVRSAAILPELARRLGVPRPLGLPAVRELVEDAGPRRYAMGDLLGRGGMGEVRAGLDADIGRWVAVKCLSPEAGGSRELRERFLAEARLAAQLEHPAIVPVHDLGVDDDGFPYFTMARLHGQTLAEAAKDLPRPRLLRAIRRVAEALDFAHDRGVLHRDVKPDNIFLDEHGAVYLLDWGLARAHGTRDAPEAGRGSAKIEREAGTRMRDPGQGSGKGIVPASADLTRAGSVLGTPAYMSPEQAAGREIDARSDIYSLGATLYSSLVGRPPYAGRTAEEVLRKVVEGPPEPAKSAGKVPRALFAIVRKAMARRRQDRYRTAGAMADDLARFEAGLSLRAGAGRLPTRAWRALRRRPRALAAAAATLATLALGGAWTAVAALSEADAGRKDEAAREARRRGVYERNLADGDSARAGGERPEALLKALVHFRLARDHAGSTAEEEVAARRLVDTHLALARLALARAAQDGKSVGPVEEAFAETEEARGVEADRYESDAIEELSREASGRALVFIQTDPPGEEVRIHRLPRDCAVPGELERTVEDGEIVELATGGYLLVAGGEGRPETRLPVYLERGVDQNRDLVVSVVEEAPPGFAYVPPGIFRAGENKELARVEEGFFLSKTEVTWGEYLEFLADPSVLATEHEPHVWAGSRRLRARDHFEPQPDHPVFGVSHDDLVAYARWRSARDPSWRYRLPTTLEWEWAARGADGREYPWGDTWDPDRTRCRENLPGVELGKVTEPAASQPLGASVFGCLHMAGNLREWTDTVTAERSYAMRGGFWNAGPLECRAWFSESADRAIQGGGSGGRLAAEPRD
ncbi:MAG: SUMF1/EgtB/PvdO family nonheme iron enzyme [Planctomycetes bacterium]|nr:SUMF1/EgtB/PvdO family nonheme iron enzyme [Planctomycetota bacterium]